MQRIMFRQWLSRFRPNVKQSAESRRMLLTTRRLFGYSSTSGIQEGIFREEGFGTETVDERNQEATSMSSVPFRKSAPHRVVFSGGPCAGKTTAMALLSDRLEALGFRVLRVPEAATIMINSGVSFEQNQDDPGEAQVSLMKLQMALEDTMVNNANNSAVNGGRQCVVIIDRGCMDGKAYCSSDSEWQEVVRRATENYDGPGSYTEEALRDSRYDQVILMATAADGAAEFYSSETNAARSEPPELAIELDHAIQHAWLGHASLTVIRNNAKDFAQKMGRAVAAVTSQLGIPKSLKDRRKFAFSGQVSLEGLTTQQFLVEETYLRSVPGTHSRLRKRRSLLEADRFVAPTYKLRHKSFNAGDSGDSVVEESQLLSFEQYHTLLDMAAPDLERTKKIRTHFIFERIHFELDEWLWPPQARDVGLRTLTIETTPEGNVSMPPDLLAPNQSAGATFASEDDSARIIGPKLLEVTGNYAWSTRAIVAGGSPWLKVDS